VLTTVLQYKHTHDYRFFTYMSTTGLAKRIIPCLDVKAGRVVKGVKFQGLRDMGDPVAMAQQYEAQGADELVFLDITASSDGRDTMLDVVKAVARQLSIPFTVGGGVRVLADAQRLLDAGADKVSINTAAVETPSLITDIATAYGAQCCVLAIDAQAVATTEPNAVPSEWHVLTHGGRQRSDWLAMAWARHAVDLGAGEILLTSWDADGTRAGFDLPLTKALSVALPVPVIASGGAHGPDSFIEVFGPNGCADAALAASLFHEGDWTVNALKQELHKAGVVVRL
jgi:imidazole glycerol-phosphate synthase subunit HisF